MAAGTNFTREIRNSTEGRHKKGVTINCLRNVNKSLNSRKAQAGADGIASEGRHRLFAMFRYRAPMRNGWERVEPVGENEFVTFGSAFLSVTKEKENG